MDAKRKLETEGGKVKREDYPYAVFVACWLLFVVLFVFGAVWSIVFASPSHAEIIARKHGIEPALLQAVCETESDWRPRVTGDGGNSIGLCQLNPETALRMFPRNWNGNLTYPQRVAAMRKLLFIPEANLSIAAVYLKYLIAKYDGDVTLALVAYNAGENHSVVRHVSKVKRKMVETYAP